MIAEVVIFERVKSRVGHPVIEGTNEVLWGVLDRLEDKIRARQIGPEFHRWLREMVLASPHFREG